MRVPSLLWKEARHASHALLARIFHPLAPQIRIIAQCALLGRSVAVLHHPHVTHVILACSLRQTPAAVQFAQRAPFHLQQDLYRAESAGLGHTPWSRLLLA